MTKKAKQQRRSGSATDSQTRKALLEAGRDCIRQHGVAKTTSRLIASRASANLAAITYYFGSKEELVSEALLGELSDRLAPVLDALQDNANPAANRLLAAVSQLVADFAQSADDVPVYLSALIQSTEPGPLQERSNAIIVDLRNKLAGVIAQLKEEEVIAAWVDPNAMASLLIAAGNGVALQTQLEPDGATVSELAGQLAGLLLAASTGSTGESG